LQATKPGSERGDLGSGEVAVAVSRVLKGDISGSGTVTYSGDPTIEQSISGSGRLIKK
jgi:hypothetical protein